MFGASIRPRHARIAAVALAFSAVLAGCGKGSDLRATSGGPGAQLAPVSAQGTVSVSTRNTTRLGGADAATDAASIARTVYPGFTSTSRPQTIVLVDEHDWAGALAASVLASSPLGAPLLYSDGASLPTVSEQTLSSMHPVGSSALNGVQVVTVGNATRAPRGYVTRSVPGGEAAPQAAALARLSIEADGSGAPHQAIVVIDGAPRALQASAAGLAAESGAPILFVKPKRVPQATALLLASMRHPAIYVVGATSLDQHALRKLKRYGPVTTIAAPFGEDSNPVAVSLAVARFTDGTFGWGVKEPGHGLVFANERRPLDGPAAAILSATGDYGPLLLLEGAAGVSAALAHYLGDIKPAYTSSVPPVRGVYNHGWLIGDESAISAVAQAEIDSLLEISPRAEGFSEASTE